MQAFPYSETEVIDFLRQQAPALLARLTPNQLPYWGQLTPPLMVAHLAEWVGRSAGRDSLSVTRPAADFEPVRQWLLSAAPLKDYPQRPMLPTALVPEAGLAPAVAAVAALRQALDDFFTYHAQHPAAMHPHPAFGPLTAGQWLVMHFKHFNHHMVQFGLLPDSLLPARRELLQPTTSPPQN